MCFGVIRKCSRDKGKPEEHQVLPLPTQEQRLLKLHLSPLVTFPSEDNDSHLS